MVFYQHFVWNVCFEKIWLKHLIKTRGPYTLNMLNKFNDFEWFLWNCKMWVKSIKISCVHGFTPHYTLVPKIIGDSNTFCLLKSRSVLLTHKNHSRILTSLRKIQNLWKIKCFLVKYFHTNSKIFILINISRLWCSYQKPFIMGYFSGQLLVKWATLKLRWAALKSIL